MGRHTAFLKTLGTLFTGALETPDLDFIGLTIKDPAAVGRLREVLSRLTDWKFELLTAVAEDGATVGLITLGKDFSDKVRKALSDEHIPELDFPVLRPPFVSGKDRLHQKADGGVGRPDPNGGCRTG